MPYGTYHVSDSKTVRNALKLMKYGGAEAVKLEGGRNRVDLVKRLVDEEIPVVAHIGLTPQSVYKLGGYRVQGRTAETGKAFDRRRQTARRCGRIRHRSRTRAARDRRDYYRKTFEISTIGIGRIELRHSGAVLHDLVGMTFGRQPRFVRQYANIREVMTEAIQDWTKDVKTGNYPNEKESYGLTQETKDELKLTD